MNPLIVVNGSGPTQANFISASLQAWPESPVLDIGGTPSWVRPDRELPAWAIGDLRHDDKTLRRRYFDHVVTQQGIDSVIAISGDAVLWAGDMLPGLPIDAVLSRGELDFSERRTGHVSKFRRIADLASRFWFESWYEMDKAVAMGSKKPHFLLPLFTVSMPVLASEASSGRLLAIVPSAWNGDQVGRWSERFRAATHGEVGVDFVTAESLYNSNDFRMRRGFPGTLRYRVPASSTHAVVLGSSSHHFAVISAFASFDANRLFVESTVNNRSLISGQMARLVGVAGGAALVERAADAVRSWSGASRPDRPLVSDRALRDAFAHARAAVVPWWYEQGMLESDAEVFDVFFTTAGIEDRSDGARPQRIRAMSESFPSDVPVVRLSSNRRVLSRRSQAVTALLEGGSRPRFGYGENSTAPMDPRSLVEFTNCVRKLRSFGMRASWFVRDLHWLSSEADYSSLSKKVLSDTASQGLRELREMERLSDIMFSPSVESGREFNRLINEAGVDVSPSWTPLPPGVSEGNTLRSTKDVADGPLRLVYSGGFGGIYDFELFLQAIPRLRVPWTLDLVVREADRERVLNAVSHLPSDQVFIEVAEFKDYLPRSGISVGVALLDSAYGDASFPFKAVSYLEKRMPVLCFKGSAVAAFLEPYGAAIPVSRTVEDVARGMELAADEDLGRRVSWAKLDEMESWSSRAKTVRDVLGVAGHDVVDTA